MSTAKDMIGESFGRLTVIARAFTGKPQAEWYCECECGETVIARGDHLRLGRISSCGCFRREHGRSVGGITTHGESYSLAYSSWRAMLKRCTDESHISYKDYGGRGITVCDQWRASFENFFSDMGDRPEGTTLDRIDNDGNYQPGNCRWADAKTQRSNQRPRPWLIVPDLSQ